MLESVHPKWFFPHFSRHLLSQRPVLRLLQNNAAKNCIWCNDSHLVSQNNFLGGKWQEHKACLSGLGKEALAVRGSSSQGSDQARGGQGFPPEFHLDRMENPSEPR